MPPQEFTPTHKEDIGKIREWLAKQPHLPQNIGNFFFFKLDINFIL